MKRLFALMLAAALALSLTACGKEDPDASSSSGGSASGSSGGSVSEPDVPDDVPDVPDGSQEEHGDGPAVVVDYPPEEIPEDMIVYREDPTDYDQAILLRAQTDVGYVNFFVLDYPEDGGPETEGEPLYTRVEMKKGDEIVIITSFPGDAPSRGISFDLDGQHEAYTLTTSGEDGSMVMTPMGGVVPGF